MRVRCIKTKAIKLGLSQIPVNSSNIFDYGSYGLLDNHEYFVMAIISYKDANYIYYLIDINGKPNWLPNELFDVTDSSIPDKWFFRIFNKESDIEIYSIFGYDELCNQDNHYDQLLEREKEALIIYFKWKEIIQR